MANSVNINIRMEKDLKDSFEMFCHDIGVSMSAAISMFAKQSTLEGRIPFDIRVKNSGFYSEENTKYLNDVIEKIESGKAKLVEHDLIEA